MEYILIFISAIFVNNIVLSQFLGICPFLGVSKKIDTSAYLRRLTPRWVCRQPSPSC